MGKYLFLVLFLFSFFSEAQYYPRGINLNDNYLPDLDAPNKWMLSLDGMLDFQKEQLQASDVTYQTTRLGVNIFYGGQVFRGGLQVLQDHNRAVKDLSLGLGIAFNRPLFFELGLGYLNRLAGAQSYDGTSYNFKVGYNVNWVMHIKYRVRIRMALMFNYKTINAGFSQNVLQFHPFLGLEFET
ncbi:MAG: hypothetical protein AAF203_09620 [Pseudomonadota bacterium]